MFKKFLAFFVSLAIISSMSLTALGEGYFDNSGNIEDALEDETLATVYVSNSGSDDAAGTEESPYKTLNKAMKNVIHNGTIVIKDTLTLASNYNFEKYGKTITITGGTLDASAKSRVILQNNTIFDNINLKFASGAKLFANGYKLVIGENATMSQASYNGSADLWVYGGGQEDTTVKSTDVTLLGGVYSRVYGGAYGGTVLGDTNLTVGGNVNPDLDITSHSSLCNFYGGGQADTIMGNTNFTYGGNAKGSYIFGASENPGALESKTATIGGVANLNVTGGKAYSIYGGSNNVNHGSDVNLTITGGEFSQIFGGNQAAHLTGNVKLNLLGSTVKRRVYGGCYNEVSGFFSYSWSSAYYVNGTVDLTIGGSANITFSDSDSDRAIYAHSRQATLSNNEVTTLVFSDEAAYTKYKNKLTAQDSIMADIMSGASAADYLHCYVYTANDTGDVITQSCKYHTSLSATATLSVDDGVSRVYNGNEIEAAKVTYSNWEWEPVELTYSNNVNAGTATVTATCGTASVTCNYEIEKADKAAPDASRLSVTNETIKGKADGKIEGLTKSMEISTDGVSFTPITAFSVPYASGTYYVRYAEKANYKASPATTITVGEGRYLVVTFKIDGETVATKEVEWNGTVLDIPEIPAKEDHDLVAPYWDVADFSEITADMEVNAVYTINKFAVSFVDRSGNTFYTAYVQTGETISQQELTNAENAVPDVYGYDFVGWDKEVEIVTEDILVNAVYSRQTTIYNTILNTTKGTVETQELEFDQRFTLVDDGAKSFLVDGQVIGGEGKVTLYGCGELTVNASENIAPQGVSVAILKAVPDEVKAKNAYRVFVHIYNPIEAEISDFGVIFAPGSAYTNDSNFTIEALDSDRYITLNADEETNDLLASFMGITTSKQVTRVVRAYATTDSGNMYSNVYSHTFN